MGYVHGGEIIAKVLMDFGIDTMFTLPSGSTDPLYKAAHEKGMKIIDTRHEQAASFAAAGYARSTGKPAALSVCLGPGMVNAVAGIANAYTDSYPMIVITGQNLRDDYACFDMNMMGDGANTQIDMIRPLTKYAVQVPSIERLADILGWAIRKATSGRPGPVYVEVPVEVMYNTIDESKVRYLNGNLKPTAPAPTKEAVEFILDKIATAERPVIVAGSGVALSDSSDYLLQFAESMNIPVLTNNLTRFIIGNHFLNGKLGFLGSAARQGIAPDLVIMMGARFSIYTGGPRGSMITDDMYVIQIDIEGGEFGRIRDADYAVVADCRETLKSLVEAMEGRNLPNFIEWATQMHEVGVASRIKAMEVKTGSDDPIGPGELAAMICDSIPSDAVICIDGGEVPGFCDTVLQVDGPRKYLAHGHMGSMGEGMPNAIGAQMAYPDKRVVVVAGDGAIGFNFMEFDTMVRHNMPIVVIILNNSCWGMCAHAHDIEFGPGNRIAVELNQTRYDEAAIALGCYGEFVTKREDVKPAIERALASGKPACINVITDAEYVAPITKRMCTYPAFTRNDEGKTYLPWHENMWI